MFYPNLTGNLIIKPLTAKLKRDKDLFTKMDPYVKVSFGAQTHKTHTSWNSGKHPGWTDSMNFKRTSEDIITFEVWDKDILSRDDMVGIGTLSMNQIFQMNNRLNEWVSLSYKGKFAGELLVDITFIPDIQPLNQNMQFGMQQQPILQQQPIFQQPPNLQNQPFYPQNQQMGYQMPYQQFQQPGFKQEYMQPQMQYTQQQQQMYQNQPNQGQFKGQKYGPNQGSNPYAPFNPNY